MRVAALAAALVAAALLPGAPLGIGVTLVGVLVLAALAAGAPLDLGRGLFAALALAFACMPAVRDAGWVVTLDLVAAWLLATAAAGGPRVEAILAPLIRLREAPSLTPPVPARFAPATRGAILGVILVVAFGTLFVTADEAFAQLVGRLPRPEPDLVPQRLLVFALVLAAALGLALAAGRPLQERHFRVPKRLSPIEWGIALVLLDALFLAFVVVQLTVLFGGNDHVLRTAGLTYAEYARSGFWQLLTAAGLTLAVIGLAAAAAETPRRRDRNLLRVLLSALCLLTGVILLSCLRRLELYEDVFGSTRLRLAVEATAFWFAGLFALLLAAGAIGAVRERLAGIVLAGTAVALLAFSLANPDGIVAGRNVAHERETGRFDLAYTAGLSADAVPALARLPASLREDALEAAEANLAVDDPWSSLNLAREEARAILAAE